MIQLWQSSSDCAVVVLGVKRKIMRNAMRKFRDFILRLIDWLIARNASVYHIPWTPKKFTFGYTTRAKDFLPLQFQWIKIYIISMDTHIFWIVFWASTARPYDFNRHKHRLILGERHVKKIPLFIPHDLGIVKDFFWENRNSPTGNCCFLLFFSSILVVYFL